jgi:hypothetical protein
MSIIQTDKETGESLYSVLYYRGNAIEENTIHAKDLVHATFKVRKVFGRQYSNVISIGLAVGAYEDATGIYI